MTDRVARFSAKLPAWRLTPGRASSLWREVPILFASLALFYALLSLAHRWMAPVVDHPEIDLRPSALPKYALFSALRVALAYLLSLVFAVSYGYIAAYNRRAERFLVPLLDTLQSIPVLSFLPGVMISMVALFPTRELGIELGSVLLIFTGQVWNIAFSFYSSLKTIPAEMQEAARIYRWSWWQRFWQLELPYAAIGLIWNSMMSVAGGWFFLIACEMFVLGNRDLRLPGLGSYLETAANNGDTRAILDGLAMMVAVILVIDQLVWRPALAWAQKFKFEQVEASDQARSFVLNFLKRSKFLPLVAHAIVAPAAETAYRFFARRQRLAATETAARQSLKKWLARALGAVALLGLGYALVHMLALFDSLTGSDLRDIFAGAGATFLRVEFTLALAGLWTIPVGVLIGLNPRLSAWAQPVAQTAASVPATALFPILLLMLIRLGGGLGVGSIVLLLLGTQWYILFNVIAGASAIPSDLKEVCRIYRFPRWELWQTLVLPAIFPYLITGFVTASGGAWNASIVAEYFHFRNQTFSVTGLGAVISRAADSGNLPLLVGATSVMAVLVVAINHFLWRRLYRLAATRFRLES